MTIREVLLVQIARTYEQESWQPSLLMAIEGLTAEQAAWKPAPERHSVWQIVRHLNLWKRAVLGAWDGETPDDEALEKADWQEVSGDQGDWEADVAALKDVSNRVRALIEEASEERLLASFGPWDRPLWQSAMAMATHDAYHAGQIRYVRALQGA